MDASDEQLSAVCVTAASEMKFSFALDVNLQLKGSNSYSFSLPKYG
jgi:hypothetical protein